jgi:hypothetical protein
VINCSRDSATVLRSRIFVSRPGALETGPCLVQIRFGLQLGGPRLAECGVVQTGIQPSDDFIGVHDRVEVGAQRVDDSGHLSADIDRSRRLQCSGRDNATTDRTGVDRRRRHLHLGCRVERPGGRSADNGGRGNERDHLGTHMAAPCTNSAEAIAAVGWVEGGRASSLEVTPLSSIAYAAFL